MELPIGRGLAGAPGYLRSPFQRISSNPPVEETSPVRTGRLGFLGAATLLPAVNVPVLAVVTGSVVVVGLVAFGVVQLGVRRPSVRDVIPDVVVAAWLQPNHGVVRFDREGPAGERELALLGQLPMVTVGAGFVVGGLTISYVGLTSVFVPGKVNGQRGASCLLTESSAERLVPTLPSPRGREGDPIGQVIQEG